MSPFYLCTVVRKYVYPSAFTAHRGAVCAVYHLGLYLFRYRRRGRQLAAGIVLLVASWLSGETLTRVPSWSGMAALAYLAIFGSLIAINAYMFLIRNVTPAVATSYAYVNPVVAVLLGTGFGGESLSLIEWLALAVIIFAVVLVTLGKYLFPVRSEATPCKASK